MNATSSETSYGIACNNNFTRSAQHDLARHCLWRARFGDCAVRVPNGGFSAMMKFAIHWTAKGCAILAASSEVEAKEKFKNLTDAQPLDSLVECVIDLTEESPDTQALHS